MRLDVEVASDSEMDRWLCPGRSIEISADNREISENAARRRSKSASKWSARDFIWYAIKYPMVIVARQKYDSPPRSYHWLQLARGGGCKPKIDVRYLAVAFL